MVSSGINVRACLPEELYKLYSVRAKISSPAIFDKNTRSRAFEKYKGKNMVIVGSDHHFIGYKGKLQNPDDVGQRNEGCTASFASG
jgi:hypothetical protein